MIRALSFFMALVLVAGLVATGLAADMVTPKYVEETASSGVDTAYMGEWQYMVGGGAAAEPRDEVELAHPVVVPRAAAACPTLRA